jgi:branched-chain amino acid transport system permease protein
MPDSIIRVLDIAIGGLLTGGIYALIAMGLSLQYGVARVLNIAHGEFIMLGAFTTWTLYTVFGINPLLTLAMIGPVVFAVGFLLHRTMFTRLRVMAPNQDVYTSNSMLATFGLLFIIQNLAGLGWGANLRAYSFMAQGVDIFGATFAANRLVSLGFAVGIGLAFYLFLIRTRMGKAIRAAAQDPATAGLMGVNINRVLAICFGLGAVMAALAGTLLSMRIPITTTMGMNYTIIAIIVVVLGGLGSIPGSFIGGFILGIIGTIVNYIEPSLSMAAYYFIFMLLLLVRPKGIFGIRVSPYNPGRFSDFASLWLALYDHINDRHLDVHHPDGELGYLFRSQRLPVAGFGGIFRDRHIYFGYIAADQGGGLTRAAGGIYCRCHQFRSGCSRRRFDAEAERYIFCYFHLRTC